MPETAELRTQLGAQTANGGAVELTTSYRCPTPLWGGRATAGHPRVLVQLHARQARRPSWPRPARTSVCTDLVCSAPVLQALLQRCAACTTLSASCFFRRVPRTTRGGSSRANPRTGAGPWRTRGARFRAHVGHPRRPARNAFYGQLCAATVAQPHRSAEPKLVAGGGGGLVRRLRKCHRFPRGAAAVRFAPPQPRSRHRQALVGCWAMAAG